MTHITIKKDVFNNITEVICDGHTNYGVSGEDIVCSALSSIVQTAVLGLLNLVQVDLNLKRDEKRGYLSFQVPKNLTTSQQHDVNLILNTMLCGISDLREGYSDFIELEVI